MEENKFFQGINLKILENYSFFLKMNNQENKEIIDKINEEKKKIRFLEEKEL